MAIQTRHEERESRQPGPPRGDDDRRGARGGRRKPNPLGAAETVDFKDVQLLKYFVSERGKLLPRRITGVTAKQQRRVAQAVKRARHLGLLPYLHLVG
ncbi:SSU ribosomal protein S18p [Cystobacter fuscus DSM 2262]|uniref:Small ribosomal subunit protein bS18 n=1 Tax=Cystobacter fuscus (strain ATCC 25194 / DSM 2262 / NBRC 100088 / M29) TaxID=1242864 RepID=S9NYF8_CYSF2|nr:30S ribosomal protein S18 [Cystobacter fuscus]EPX55047.1 SSU ribosomal protein S18p [Cystobacter fuscus DSM 2262]